MKRRNLRSTQMLSFWCINIVLVIKIEEEKKPNTASFSSTDMRTECTTGSAREVNVVRPSFLKSPQRPVSWTAHFNVSVCGLREGPDWPLYKARSVRNPPTFLQTHHLKAPSHTRNYPMLMLFSFSSLCRCKRSFFFHAICEVCLLHLYK